MSFVDQFQPYKLDNYGYIRLPEIHISEQEKTDLGLKKDASNLEFLTALARQGFKDKSNLIPKDKYKLYGDRIKNEILILEELGFIDYILLVWQIINKARQLGVFIDYGRGSVAGSAVCWLIGISGVDPIKHELYFERFVSRARAGKKYIDGKLYLKGDLLADVDINLGDSIDKIVEYLNEIYPNRISKIINISTFTTKILLKDVYKSYSEATENEAREIADMIEVRYGIAQTIDEAYEKNTDFKNWTDKNKEVIKIAKKLDGLMRQVSTHASGYLIGFYELNDLIPLELSKDGELVSGYDMREVSNFFCKLDFLGLATNRIIRDILSNIQESIDKINCYLESDYFIYSKFQDGNLLPYGLYQISADCAYGVTNKVKPLNVNELSHVNALARPGALDYVGRFCSNSQECPHPTFEEILKPTRNFCIYQETMMQMAVKVGFTLEEAETLRKIVGKKLVDKVKEWKEKIYKKCEDNGFSKDIGDILWKILDDSSKYSFNKSHSLATSYLTALTVYLKYKYPLQFYLACLKATKELANPIEEVTAIQKEMIVFNINLLPPSLTKSKEVYTIEDGNIRAGLEGIKGLSAKGLEKLHNFRNASSNKFQLFEAFQAASIPLSVSRPLILSGCLDSDIHSRSKLLVELELYKELTDREKPLIHNLGAKYNFDLFNIIKVMNEELKDEKGKPLIKDSRRATLKKKITPAWQKYQANIKNEELSAWVFENEFLGFSYSTTLHKLYSKTIENLVTVEAAKKLPEREKFVCAAVIDECEFRTSRKGKIPYLLLQLKDETGTLKGFVWNDEAIDANEKANGQKFKAGQIVVVHGVRKHEDGCYVNLGVIQENFVITKNSQLAEKEKEVNAEPKL